MMRRFSVCSCLLVLAACSILLALPLPAAAGTCNGSIPQGTYTVTTSQYTGPIDMGCDIEDVKVKIVVNYNFGNDCNGTVTFHRCGASSEIYYIACHSTYIVSVSGTWADGLAECQDVSIVQQQ